MTWHYNYLKKKEIISWSISKKFGQIFVGSNTGLRCKIWEKCQLQVLNVWGGKNLSFDCQRRKHLFPFGFRRVACNFPL